MKNILPFIAVLALLIWLSLVGTMIYVAVHFIVKYW